MLLLGVSSTAEVITRHITTSDTVHTGKRNRNVMPVLQPVNIMVCKTTRLQEDLLLKLSLCYN